MNNPFQTPQYQVSNKFNLSQKDTCVGPNNYFKQCLEQNKNVIYGSERPMKEECPVITGTTDVPCNSIWNNLTRRKTLVEY
jgi:hypothetical protein